MNIKERLFALSSADAVGNIKEASESVKTNIKSIIGKSIGVLLIASAALYGCV